MLEKSEKPNSSQPSKDAQPHPFFEYYEKLLERADKEIERIDSWHKKIIYLASAIIVIVGVVGYGSLREFLQAVEANCKEDALKKVEIMVNDQFKEPRIREILESVASTHAGEIIQEQIEPEVVRSKALISSETAVFQAQVQSALDDFDNFSDLITITDTAQTGDRRAYDELMRLARENSKIGHHARRRVTVVRNALSIYNSLPLVVGDVTFYDGPSSDPNTKEIPFESASTTKAFDLLGSPDIDAHTRREMMFFITDRPIAEIYREAARTLRESDSLYACAAVCGILSFSVGPRAEFLELDRWAEICDEQLTSPTLPITRFRSSDIVSTSPHTVSTPPHSYP